VARDHIYIGSSDGHLYALRRNDGGIAWRFEAGDRVWTSPAVVGGRIYFGSHTGSIYALAPQ
jgi:outer membrane protein assembly factor BamB